MQKITLAEIRVKLFAKGIPQADLADASKIPAQSLSPLLKGRSGYPLETYRDRLESGLGVLFGGEWEVVR